MTEGDREKAVRVLETVVHDTAKACDRLPKSAFAAQVVLDNVIELCNNAIYDLWDDG